MAKKNVKSNKPGRCPVCGTMYKNGSMASKCQRTESCRFFHAPGGFRLRAFEVQIGVGNMVTYIFQPLSKHPICDDEDTEKLIQLANKGNVLMRTLVNELTTLAISDTIFTKIDKKVSEKLMELWPLGTNVFIVHMIAVAANLVCDLKSELQDWFKHYPRFFDIWKNVEDILDEIYDMYDPNGEEDYEDADKVEPCYEKLYSCIFGPDKGKPQLKLYSVGSRFMVAAHTKQEAKELVTTKYGLVNLPVKGMALGMKFEDGQTVTDILNLAMGVPMVVAFER